MAKLFCQDVIIKKDSSRIEVKLLEIRPTEIKYKLFNYLEGPNIIISTNDVAYIIYSNGQKEVFETKVEPLNSFYLDKPIVWKGDTARSTKYVEPVIGDYIKFNIQLGAVINNAFSNLPSTGLSIRPTPLRQYSGNNKEKYYCNPNIGFNFLFGKNRYIKHVIGINYLRSQGEFDITKSSRTSYDYNGHTYATSSFHYKSTVDFINFVTGVRCTIFRHFNIEFLVAGNLVTNTNEKITGTITTKTYSGGPIAYPISENVEYVNINKNSKENLIMNSSVSLCPKISYEFSIKKQKLGIYYSYNMPHEYFLYWHMFGITYYPFKKLNAAIDDKKTIEINDIKKKIKLFNGMKLNIDAAIVFNRGYTNTHENYSGIKPANPKIYKTGYKFGLNFYHGKTEYFKHYISAYFIESQADLLRRTYMYTYDSNSVNVNEVIKTTTYNSKVYFLNFATGIRFIAFKHLNFDNGIALNMPVYSKNIIQHDETFNRYENHSNTPVTSTSITTEKSNSNDLFIEKTNWLIMSKIGYDFNIKQNKFGLFIEWNSGLDNNSQWHMIGLTYYPFKKLR